MKTKYFSLETGLTRRALILHPLRIVVKFPRFNFFRGLRVFWKIFLTCYYYCIFLVKGNAKLGYIRLELKWKLLGHYEQPNSLFWFWFRGWFANVNEARYFITNPNNPLLIPTYFSFFGLFNIQPQVEPLENWKGVSIFQKCYISTDIQNEMTNHDSHAWENGNFTQRTDGTIALYDYGSSRAWPMVKKYGHRFSKLLLTTK